MVKVDDAVIETEDLRKSFKSRGGPVQAVGGVSMSVRRGEVFGFLGPNGAGKTTTLRMLTTLLPIDEGRARVAGCDVQRDPGQVRRRIGYVSQLGGADDLASGRENLILQGRLYGLGVEEVAARADELIELLDLGEFADRRVKRTRAGSAAVWTWRWESCTSPRCCSWTSPPRAWTRRTAPTCGRTCGKLRDRGTTIFLTTHYLEEADALCDRLTIIDHGTIVAEGTPQELKREVAGDTVLFGLRGRARGAALAAAGRASPTCAS